MTIYIASSWKNQHAVEMLTALLREHGHKVLSFVENNYGEGAAVQKPIVFEEWILTEKADQSFWYDTNGAGTSDLVIYISPSGKDAAAEVGIAWAKGVPILGLHAKGEDFGLMRKLILEWYYHYDDLLQAIKSYKPNKAYKEEVDKEDELWNEVMQEFGFYSSQLDNIKSKFALTRKI